MKNRLGAVIFCRQLLYNLTMGLYWKDIEIVPGMLLEMDMLHNEVFNSDGEALPIRWRILSFDSRKSDDAYIDYNTGRKYPMAKVIKKRRLQALLERNILLQLPAGSDFMIVEEFHGGETAGLRCYNLDMLQTVRNIRVVEE